MQANVLEQMITDRYAVYNGDCVELCQGLPDNSIHYTIFSPPFSSLYTYSNSERDMGNSKNDDEFYNHFRFLVDDLYRATMPGRLLSFHCMNLPSTIQHNGYIGIRDFRGELIKMFVDAGWIYHSEVCIWKDPVTAMQRTKALGLLHKQLKKDSCMSRQGIPDYLVTMRKPGVNPEPVTHTNDTFPVGVWQHYASPVWMDINQSRTLQKESARENDDEKHICLAAGSLVLTNKGFKQIEDVDIGDLTLTHKGNWKPIIAKKCTGINNVIHLKAQGVPNLIVTPNHKIWARISDKSRAKEYMPKTKPDWQDAQLTKGAWVNMKLPDTEPTDLTNTEWWIVGRYLADGHIGKRGDFHISVGRAKQTEFESVASDYIGTIAEREALQYRLKNVSASLKQMLLKCGKGAGNKQVPIQGICLEKEPSEYLLAGYLSGDGNKTGNATSASSISRSLLLGMAMVAQRARFVIPSVFKGKPSGTHVIQGRTVNQRQLWVLSWRDGTHHFGEILNDGAWKKVRSCEDCGTAETWSLQVADDASFTAEGCIVKNCPLQLDVIQRGIELWSNPGDTVLSPFAGIGSEGYQAVLMDRKFIGFELKSSYYRLAVHNLASAASHHDQGLLFGEEGVI